MRLSKFYMPTLREAPADAEIASHKLLLRAGMIKRLVSGIYCYLPLGKKVLDKIEKIVREEMDKSGGQEVLMSAIQSAEVWQQSGRWANFGPEMFRLKDRNGREFCLGPTHEEIFTMVIREVVNSYKQLPLNLYQIQTKYRDEKRPRFGVIRAREFIMKDAYTFDRDSEGMVKSYDKMKRTYSDIFDMLKIRYKIVEGDSGAMGGSDSHEFTALAPSGESNIIYCPECDYAATDEKASCFIDVPEVCEMLPLKKVHTPNVGTIADLKEFFNSDGSNFVKTLIVTIKEKPIAVLIPGNRELNPLKLIKLFSAAEHEFNIADEETVIKVTGAKVGFAGPIGLKEDIPVYADKRVTLMKNFLVGANETDYHYLNVNFKRDFDAIAVEDLVMAQEGDMCPVCHKKMLSDRGIEVGNIFQLGTKYTDALDVTYLDENGKSQKIWMGSHGIGISRTMAAIIEQNHDEKGIIWPLVTAPYQIIIITVNSKKAEQVDLSEKIYEKLTKIGYEVLLDDRNERAGVKFNDAELIGIPIQINVGRKADESVVEYGLRRTGIKEEINVDEIIERIEKEFKFQNVICPKNND